RDDWAIIDLVPEQVGVRPPSGAVIAGAILLGILIALVVLLPDPDEVWIQLLQPVFEQGRRQGGGRSRVPRVIRPPCGVEVEAQWVEECAKEGDTRGERAPEFVLPDVLSEGGVALCSLCKAVRG